MKHMIGPVNRKNLRTEWSNWLIKFLYKINHVMGKVPTSPPGVWKQDINAHNSPFLFNVGQGMGGV